MSHTFYQKTSIFSKKSSPSKQIQSNPSFQWPVHQKSYNQIIYKTHKMKRQSRSCLFQIQQKISEQRQRMKQISHNKRSGIYKAKQNNEHLIIFNAKEYPFKNQLEMNHHTYKTILHSEAIENILEKLLLLAHANVIQIQKIARSKPKNESRQTNTYYSFYYEVVPFSLRFLSENRHMVELPSVTSVQLCQILVEISDYLMKEDIYYLLTPDTIGITEEGEIKVYVSPLEILNDKNEHLTKLDVMTSIDNLLGWWNNTGETERLKKEKKNNGFMSSSLGFNTQQIRKRNEKIISSYIQEESKMKQRRFPQKMKNIEQEIRNIKEKFKGKIKDRERKRSDNVLNQLKNQQKEDNNVNPNYQSTQIFKKQAFEDNKNKGAPNQNIQQNINCINIYNHPPKEPAPKKMKNMQHKESFNSMKESQNLVRMKNRAMDQLPDNEFMHEEEGNISIDTYDMDLDIEFDPPIAVTSDFRSSFAPLKRQASEGNQIPIMEDVDSSVLKKSSNQVVPIKNFTQSAGPLQFKNFLVQFIKPQFLAKRSNIYEDPGEYDSQKSHSISNRVPMYYKQLADAGKMAASYRQNSVSLRKSDDNNNSQSIKNDHKVQIQPNNLVSKVDQNKPKALFKVPIRGESAEKNKFIKIQKSQGIFRSRIEDDQMNTRLQTALEKTRNALAILKKVRMSKSPLYFKTN